MEFDLKPRFAQNVFKGDGGALYSWSSSEFPFLGKGKVGANKIVLRPRGFAFPHYSDSSKIAYILEGGGGIVGMVFPDKSEEVVLRLKKGDVIPVAQGVVSWWFNDGDSEFSFVLLGETTKSYISKEFTFFLLSGAQGIMGGFSPEFLSRTYNVNKDDANKLAQSQNEAMIIKLPEGKRMPKPNEDCANQLVYNIDDALPDVSVKNGGLVTTLTEAEFPFLGQAELSAKLVKLDSKAMCSPTYTTDFSVQLIYVVKGTGQIQIVGINGKQVLDTEVKPGHLLVVPRFFVVAKLAGEDGLECVSITTTKQPILEDLASKESVWEALSPAVIEASLNVSIEWGELFMSKIDKSSILIPSEN
ncbi:11S globulin seed storage protein 2 [Quercus suber]|uniref:11S globulin seed storage protein 2 n=1 Tax=Quercus suber TaxID=58331 RepID=UPI0032DF6258